MKGAGYLALALAGVAAFIWGVLHIPPIVQHWAFIVVPIFFAGSAVFAMVAMCVDGVRARAAGRPEDVPWAGMTIWDVLLGIGFILPILWGGAAAIARL